MSDATPISGEWRVIAQLPKTGQGSKPPCADGKAEPAPRTIGACGKPCPCPESNNLPPGDTPC